MERICWFRRVRDYLFIVRVACIPVFTHLYSNYVFRYVTWEIAPGRLADGSIVDVWGRSNTVDWRLPGSGAPCTSTARPGRWRSFPYLAGIEGEEGDVLWRYLCDEWNREHDVSHHHRAARQNLRRMFPPFRLKKPVTVGQCNIWEVEGIDGPSESIVSTWGRVDVNIREWSEAPGQCEGR